MPPPFGQMTFLTWLPGSAAILALGYVLVRLRSGVPFGPATAPTIVVMAAIAGGAVFAGKGVADMAWGMSGGISPRFAFGDPEAEGAGITFYAGLGALIGGLIAVGIGGALQQRLGGQGRWDAGVERAVDAAVASAAALVAAYQLAVGVGGLVQHARYDFQVGVPPGGSLSAALGAAAVAVFFGYPVLFGPWRRGQSQSGDPSL